MVSFSVPGPGTITLLLHAGHLRGCPSSHLWRSLCHRVCLSVGKGISKERFLGPTLESRLVSCRRWRSALFSCSALVNLSVSSMTACAATLRACFGRQAGWLRPVESFEYNLPAAIGLCSRAWLVMDDLALVNKRVWLLSIHT